ncbi:LOW QUALITY PROTEIN: coagulation factor VII-like [Bombina bombina]|uniref:LOW QUALITY PROTEIN: coagulation factor VII-like n=1 Tax=Bombina bombina TaxID=8345 RepID=UPI00235AF0C3|nr:LOW QUALITY PROTEIN: coagulation factor VII-like [Bombina bombina]
MMTSGFLFVTLVLLSISSCNSVFIGREMAHHVLKKRANHFIEEIMPGNLERECYEETCSKEEAREIFKSQEKTTEFWYHYKDLSPCKENPCKNGGICQQYHYSYTCLCPPRYHGRHCENARHECWYNNGGCWQYCTDTARSMSVICSCAQGYTLQEDGKSCAKTGLFPCGLTISSPHSKRAAGMDFSRHVVTRRSFSNEAELTTPKTKINETADINYWNETSWKLTSNKTSENNYSTEINWIGNQTKTSPIDGWNETRTMRKLVKNKTESSNLNETKRYYNGNSTAQSFLNETTLANIKNNTGDGDGRNETTNPLEASKHDDEDLKDWPDDNSELSDEYDQRIVGGTRCELGHCPWQVLIRTSRGQDFCSGSLISSRWVLSAAHCFEGLDPHHVTVGDYDKYRRDQDEQKIAVLQVFSHPYYQGLYYDHDLALLFLRSPVIFSKSARPICLPSPVLGRLLTQEGEIGQVSGWGSIKFSGSFSRFLLRVQLPIVSQETCMASTDQVLTGNMFCAGYSGEAKDSCKGDSGGPFAVSYRNTWYLVGVVSWGEGCAAEGKYGAYTRVSNYIQWIKETILEKEGVEEPLVATL